MPESTTSSGDSTVSSPDPATSSDAKENNATTKATPAAGGKGAAAGETHKPAQAAAAAGNRSRSNSKKPEPPTLLHDFLLGRPSPARLAAERKRRQSFEAVRADLRNEMRQTQVRKLQPPGGVRDRVKSWQKANAAMAAAANPEDGASEPTDVAFDGQELDSVTEEDRVRIKMRQKRRPPKKPVIHNGKDQEGKSEEQEPSKPPKKRIVSDDNWMKPKVRKPSARKVSPRPRKTSNNQTRIPNGFVFRSIPNPSYTSKVQAWANNVEMTSSRSRKSSANTAKTSALDHDYSDYDSDMDGTITEVAARKPLTPRVNDNDGIRVQPIRKKRVDDDDGIRVRPMKASASPKDDGIRVRPMNDAQISGSGTSRQSSLQKPRNKTPKKQTILDLIRAVEEATQLSMSDEADDANSQPDTPTQDPRPKSRSVPKRTATRYPKTNSKPVDVESELSDETSRVDRNHVPDSDLGTSLTEKSLADIPGDIPFGHSAFSELDLPLRGPPKSVPKRIKVDRTSSLKSMPNMLKKVMEEGKKIIQDLNEPPRHVVPNNPPSIEKWLNNTMDAYDGSKTAASPTTSVMENDGVHIESRGETTPRRKPSHETKSSHISSNVTSDMTSYLTSNGTSNNTSNLTSTVDSATTEDDATERSPESSKSTPKAKDSLRSSKTPPSSGLKRSKATRAASSTPSKPSGRRPFLGVLKQAFQGESAGLSKPIKIFQSHEERKFESDEDTEMDPQYMQSNSDLGSWSTTDTHSSVDQDSSVRMAKPPLHMSGPRLRPPTNGNYELSTILSEGGSSALESEVPSEATQSALAHPTNTGSSEAYRPLERQTSGLKRRLTRHSDLASALSLPGSGNVPERIKSNRSRPSQRKARGLSNDVTADDLLREFTDDENLYQRELKTLVDGVVPVLLSHVVSDVDASGKTTSSAKKKNDEMSKSVVNMGIALEKLKTAHDKAPLTDIRRVAHWAHGVVPIYNSYLSAWRLGFQDLIVNLAPRGDAFEDEDSLLDALPRDENGDVVNAQGERVAVAYLLKRPLIRVRQMSKLIKCVDLMFESSDNNELVKDFETLLEKARLRHKEELARITDEEAANTDTTRVRDLRTLGPTKPFAIDSDRQVSAKDMFSLDLCHSNGQRLECQVELVYRDNQSRTDDAGDLLIREVGDGRRSYLLFPPISMSLVSARPGDGKQDMVMMIRGKHNGNEWYELLDLWADDDDQTLDWLDMLPSLPRPPEDAEPSIFDESDLESASPSRLPDVPVGVQSMLSSQDLNYDSDSTASAPGTPTRAAPQPPRSNREKTPTQEDFESKDLDRSRPLKEGMRPDSDALKRSSALYEDGEFRDRNPPPRPPIHRTLSPSPQQAAKSQSLLKPPVEPLGGDRLKRRGSSPLKHEYLPSEPSSASGLSSAVSSVVAGDEEFSDNEDISDIESDSDEEIESIDIPQTELGFSIREDSRPRDPLVPPSECSLTPSNSASQAGLHGRKTSESSSSPARCLAAISRWSDKGTWKDIHPDHCSIIISDGLIEAYAYLDNAFTQPEEKPLLALDLTPLVLIRQSTAVDLEIRSSVQPHSKLASVYSSGNFRFRCLNGPDCYNLYMAVHHSRLNNQKFIELENEARFKSFGERPASPEDGDSSSRRRSWFGRKNSYRSSVRAPSQSQDGASSTPSSSHSASSFLKKLTLVGNLSFNLARSSVDNHGQGASAGNSLYTSGSSSGYGTPRSPSVSVENSGREDVALGTENIRIRLHLLISSTKWEDHGNCSLQIRRPPPGWRQALRADLGLEKRITVTTLPRKATEKPIVVLDAVLGSGCFSPMGSRGIVCGIWEEVKGGDGAVGGVPETGATGGNIKKWCFQFSNVNEASWVLRLVHQEVITAS